MVLRFILLNYAVCTLNYSVCVHCRVGWCVVGTSATLVDGGGAIDFFGPAMVQCLATFPQPEPQDALFAWMTSFLGIYINMKWGLCFEFGNIRRKNTRTGVPAWIWAENA